MTGIGLAYTSLTSEQKTIAAYLIGAFNNVYLMARGFSYSIPADETSWKAQFIALGEKVWQFATTAYGWKSRFNETFRQYLSSVCVYASGINSTFEAWYQLNTGTGELYIPYSEDAFSAWTEFYNDPSGDGIATFGDSVSDWQSGNFYDFAFAGIPWVNSNAETNYNNFILNNSPVLYSNMFQTEGLSANIDSQYIIGFSNLPDLVDSLFILRSNNNQYSSFRFGFSDMRTTLNNNIVYMANIYVGSGTIRYSYINASINFTSIRNVANQTFALPDMINYAFKYPIDYFIGNSLTYPEFWYPYVSHVYLVDNLSTLSNPEEIYNTDSLNIVAPDPAREPYILAPNDRLLFPTRPVGYDDPLGFWDIVIDNSIDENGDTVSDDDFHQQIVNNTTINNYYVTNDDRINVPVEWFENDLTDQLANDSIPFLTFARDCIDTLGDLQVYLYGAIVFGLGGGILKKFLL